MPGGSGASGRFCCAGGGGASGGTVGGESRGGASGGAAAAAVGLCRSKVSLSLILEPIVGVSLSRLSTGLSAGPLTPCDDL